LSKKNEEYIVRPYRDEDEPHLRELNNRTPIVGTFTFVNEKDHFLDRANKYTNHHVLVAEAGGKRIGVFTGTIKSVKTEEGLMKAAYLFDLRVDPDYRGRGVAMKLMFEMGDIMALKEEVDLLYVLKEKKNLATTNMFDTFGSDAYVLSPCYYCLFPLYRKEKIADDTLVKFKHGVMHQKMKQLHENDNFYTDIDPIFNSKCYSGSYHLASDPETYFSIWDESAIRRERVVHVPLKFRLLDKLFALISPVKKLPRIPKENQLYKTWYVFGIESSDPERKLPTLLKLLNNMALENGQNLVIIPFLANPNDLTLKIIKKKAFSTMKLNIAYLKVNSMSFDPGKNYWFDIRDI